MQKVLLVGLNYTGPALPGVEIDVLGLCRATVDSSRSASALYEYDLIVIFPESYSHFLFGRSTTHSGSDKELWDLKAERNDYDLDSAYDQFDRASELSAALSHGSRVVWLLAPEKRVHFFGWRSLHIGYANLEIERLLKGVVLHQKKSKKLTIGSGANGYTAYFQQLQIDGWSIAMSNLPATWESIAQSLEGHSLGARVPLANSVAWLLTGPTTQDSANALVLSALKLSAADVSPPSEYHGLFLSHTSADKAFAREIRSRFEAEGVKVWLDEAEILVGDSLTKKISEGLEKTKYIGVILSPRSVKSRWVEKELDIAMNKEISTGDVVVLPLIYEPCDLPGFLVGKLYADFTCPESYDEAMSKVLRRLRRT